MKPIINKIILFLLFLISSYFLILSILKEHRIILGIGVLLITAGIVVSVILFWYLFRKKLSKRDFKIYTLSPLMLIFLVGFMEAASYFIFLFVFISGIMGYFTGFSLILKRFKTAAILLFTAIAFIASFHYYVLPVKLYSKNLDRFVAKKESYDNLRFYYLDGSLVDTVDYRGKIIVLNFWFTGCVPCETKKPAYSKLYEHYRSYPEVFIADVHANMLKYIPLEVIKSNLSKSGYSVPVLYDFDSFQAKEMGVTSMPVEIIMDNNLNVVSTYWGYDRYDSNLYLQNRMRIIDSLLAVK